MMTCRALLLFALLAAAGCQTTRGLSWDQTALLSGKWEGSCTGPIGSMGALECPEMLDIETIDFDEQTGRGKWKLSEQMDLPIREFRAFEENRKLYLAYLDPQGVEQKGEIVQLDEKTLCIHYPEDDFMTWQQRAQ